MINNKEILRDLLRDKATMIFDKKKSANIKEIEIAFQDVIEGVYSTKEKPCWWQWCKLDIFTHLFTHHDIDKTIEAIVNNIKE